MAQRSHDPEALAKNQLFEAWSGLSQLCIGRGALSIPALFGESLPLPLLELDLQLFDDTLARAREGFLSHSVPQDKVDEQLGRFRSAYILCHQAKDGTDEAKRPPIRERTGSLALRDRTDGVKSSSPPGRTNWVALRAGVMGRSRDDTRSKLITAWDECDVLCAAHKLPNMDTLFGASRNAMLCMVKSDEFDEHLEGAWDRAEAATSNQTALDLLQDSLERLATAHVVYNSMQPRVDRKPR